MGQAYSAFSILLGVASPRHKSFTETKGIKGPIVTKSTDKPKPDVKKKSEKDKSLTESDIFGLSKIYGGGVTSDNSKTSKSWLGPSPKPPSDTKTAISPGPEKFQIPHDKDDMLREDCSKADTILMMPITEDQMFLRKEEKQSSDKDTTLVTPKKSVTKKKKV